MRIAILLLTLLSYYATAFAPCPSGRHSTELQVNRRDLLMAGTLGLLFLPKTAEAASSTFFYDMNIENVREESQMATDGRLDLNAAFVGDYKALRGLYPHAAGKLASNGPYYSVKEIYKIPGLTDNDVALFKKYDKYFTVNPPGRAFHERINNRVST